MFVVMTRYLMEFDPADPHVQEHRKFLSEQAAAGRVVLSGPRNPRLGGLTVYDMPSESDLQQLLSKDPMRIAGMLETEIFEFTATIAADSRHLDPSVASV
jgi:uncharacterized protein YciI